MERKIIETHCINYGSYTELIYVYDDGTEERETIETPYNW